MSFEDYVSISKSQNDKCLICGQPETATYRGETKILCVDHCHTTGKVRGLLCNRCNKAIGLMEDSKELLQNAVNYLEEKQCAS